MRKQTRWNEKGIRQVDARRGRAGHCGDEAVDSLELAGKAGIKDFKHSAERIRWNQDRNFPISNWYLYTCPMPYTIRRMTVFTPAMDYPQAHTANVQKWSHTGPSFPIPYPQHTTSASAESRSQKAVQASLIPSLYHEHPPNPSTSPIPLPPHPPNKIFFLKPTPYISPLIRSKCFNTAVFASKNLSTQLAAQLSSFPLIFPLDIPPVMHFVQQMSVRLWIAVFPLISTDLIDWLVGWVGVG